MNGTNGLEGIISKLTENPEMMKNLMNVAGNIMNSQPNAEKSAQSERTERSMPSASNDRYNDDRADHESYNNEHQKKHHERKRGDDAENLICLLIALKPYVSPDRCDKIDSIVKILKLVQLSEKTGLLKSLL